VTASAARALALAPASTSEPGESRAGRVRALLRPEFLAAVWQADGEVFAPPRDHPLLGLRKCAVADCEAGVRTPNTDLCKVCVVKFNAGGLPMDQFTAVPCGKVRKGEKDCGVPRCPRPARFRVGLCYGHYAQWRGDRLPVAEWAASPGVMPLPSFGDCPVVSCSRAADSQRGLCAPHRQRWALAEKKEPGVSFERWLLTAEPVNADHFVIFKGLPEQVQLELLLGLQLRADTGVRTLVTALRPMVAVLRQTQAATIDDLDESLIKQTRHDAAVLARHLAGAVQRATITPAEEQRKDTWDLRVLGLGGWLRFTAITQPWLREAAKAWAAEEIPRRRGRQAAGTAKTTVSAIGDLSNSLRLARDDHGEAPAALGRRDIVGFTNRQAHLQRTGQITEHMRLEDCRAIRRFLADVRAMGLTRAGGVAAGLPDDFIMGARTSRPSPTRMRKAGTCPPG
jgi:hypothetical protein